MNTRHVDGITVVDVSAGHRLGRVVDLLLDPSGRNVTAFIIQSGGGGLLTMEPATLSWLAVENVRAVGPDALTVDDATCLREFPPAEDTIPVSELLKRQVVTEGGVSIGPVGSLDFDERSMKTTSFEITTGIFKSNRAFAAEHLVSIGPEFIVVADAVVANRDQDDAGDDQTPDAAATEHSRVVGDIEQPASAS